MNTNLASSTNRYIYSFLTTISVVGTIGNLMVVIVYWQKKDKQTSTFFILVLAFSDLAVCSILVPMTIYMEKILFDTDSTFLCKTYFFLTTTIVPSSSLLMSAIAFDRYFCICKVNQNIMTLIRARVSVIIILIVSTLMGVIPFLGSVVINVEILSESNNYSFMNVTNNIDHHSHHHLCFIDTESRYSKFGVLIMPFKYFYDLIYAISVIMITILYVLIYKEIHVRRKIKRNRKREILFSSLINQAENGIFPETLLIKNDDFKDESYTIRNQRMNLFKNCCMDMEGRKGIYLNDESFRKKFDENFGVEADTLTFLQSTTSINKFKETEINKNVKYDINEQKIILNMLNKKEKNDLSPNSLSVDTNIKYKTTLKNLGNNSVNNKKNNNKTIKTSNKKVNFQNLGKSGRINKKKHKHNKNKATFKRDSTVNSKIIPFLILIKDTRTAFMLFVVSIVFITSYLPSILATKSLLPNDNLYIVYLYFTNSAINPIIYSFMNRSFRSDLIKLFKNKSKPIFSVSKFSSFTVFSISPNIELKNIV